MMVLELRGYGRGLARRLKTPKGALFAFLGGSLLGLWIFILASDKARGGLDSTSSFAKPEFVLRCAGLAMFLLVAISAIMTRGINIPPGKLDRVFSLPISRSDFLRYRLWCVVGRTMAGAPLLALLATTKTGHPLGTLLAVPLFLGFVSVVGFFCSLLAAAIEGSRSFAAMMQRLRQLGKYAIVGIAILLVMALLSTKLPDLLPQWSAELQLYLREMITAQTLEQLVYAGSRPLEPFVRLALAPGLAQSGLFLAASLGTLLLSVELVSRTPVDFRELAIEGASSAAKRIRSVGRVGRAASAGKARVGLWAVPHLFGRGPMGAVAWRKVAAIWRKSRGFLGISLFLGCFLLFAIRMLFGDALLVSDNFEASAEELILSGNLGGCVLSLLGTLYLTNGLRFDFREDLEQLDILRAWPVAAWRIFVGSLLPQVAAISGILSVLLLIWFGISAATGSAICGLIFALPQVVFAWVAVDNIAFLFWPVRFIPGQSGQLQHIGRGLLLSLARITFFLLTFGASLASAGGTWWALVHFGDPSDAALIGWVVLVGYCVLLAANAGLALLGGFAFSSFDPVRDRAL